MTIAQRAKCKHCGRTNGEPEPGILPLIVEGEGPTLVCRPCIRALGELAADPTGTDDRVLAAIADRHSDVVRLGRTVNHRGQTRLVWEWIGWATT